MSALEKVKTLSPLLETVFDNEQLKQIYCNLQKKKVLINDLASTDDAVLHTLITTLSLLADNDWPNQLIEEIKNTGNDQITAIVNEYLLKNNNRFLWILRNWRDLIKNEHAFVDLEWMLPNTEATKPELLVNIVSLCLESESRPETMDLIVGQMQSNVQKNCPNIKHHKGSSIKCQHSKIFDYLQPMLEQELTSQEIVDLATHLNKKQIVSKDALMHIKKLAVGAHRRKSEIISLIVKSVKQTKNKEWERAFLESVFNSAGSIISHFCEACLKHNASIVFQWISINWEKLKSMPDIFNSVCEEESVLVPRTDDEPKWLLCAIHPLYIQKESDVKKFGSTLFNKLHYDPPRTSFCEHSRKSDNEAKPDEKSVNYPSTPLGLKRRFGRLPRNSSAHLYQRLWQIFNDFMFEEDSSENQMDVSEPNKQHHLDFFVEMGDEFQDFVDERASNTPCTSTDTLTIAKKHVERNGVEKVPSSGDIHGSQTHKPRLSSAVGDHEGNSEKRPLNQSVMDKNIVQSNENMQLTSEESSDIKVCSKLTCIKSHNCSNIDGITLLQPSKEEKMVEMRLIVDENIGVGFHPFVYVDSEKTKFKMHEDGLRSGCFHTFLCVAKNKEELIYKYLIRKGAEDKWEELPSQNQTVVNRKRLLKQNCNFQQDVILLFDTCTFNGSDMPLGQFISMYTRNMVLHLPNPKALQLTTGLETNLKCKMFFQHLCHWWLCAKHGIRFTFCSHADIEPTCNSHLRQYVMTLSANVAGWPLVLANLFICCLLHKFKISFPNEDENSWKNICSVLCISDLSSADYSVLCTTIANVVDRREVIESILYVFGNNKSSPHCLLLLPLVYIVENNGYSDFAESKWKIIKDKFDKVKFQLKKEENFFWGSKELQNKVKKLAQNFPWFPKLYQEISSIKSNFELLKKDADFYKLYDAELLFTTLAVKKNLTEICPILNKSPDVANWIHDTIKRKLDGNSQSEEDAKLHKNIVSLFTSISYNVGYKADNVDVLKWVFSLVFLFPQSEMGLRKIVETVTNSLKKDPKKGLTEEKLKFLTFLVEKEHDDEETAKSWQEQVQMLTKDIFLWQIRQDTEFVNQFDDFSQSGLNPVVMSCFWQATESYVDECSKSKAWSHNISTMIKGNRKRILPIIRKLFFKHWGTSGGSNIDKVLHLIQHPLSLMYLKHISNEDSNDRQSRSVFRQCEQGIANVMKIFKAGNISYKNLKELLAVQDDYLTALSMLKKDSSVDEKLECSVEIFNIRRLEFDMLTKFQEASHHCATLCEAAVRDSFQDDWVAGDIQNMSWSDVVECYVDGKEKPKPEWKPKIMLFGITDVQHQAFVDIYQAKVNENTIIFSHWTKLYKALLQRKQEGTDKKVQLSTDDVLKGVWVLLAEEFCPLKEQLRKGTIQLADVEKYFSTLDKDAVTAFYEAISRFPTKVPDTAAVHEEDSCENATCNNTLPDNSETDEQIKTLRVRQICNYFSLKQQQSKVAAILEIKRVMNLCGDFDYLKMIQDDDKFSEEKQLASISDTLIEAVILFDEITVEHCNLVTAFTVQQILIEWLGKMEDRSEVKVMSDLAMISAGESVLDVECVSCFLSAVMGFAPFIFDLDENSGLKHVLSAILKVGEHSKKDPLLLEKWESTASKLNWLKGIKDFHGSVEKSSLVKVQNINTQGTYVIMCNRKVPSVDTAVKLRWISETTDQKDMTLADLQDLQSRLMLIEDKGLKEVKLFIQTLSVVENLAQAYIDLKVAGCLLFTNWSVNIGCKSASNEEHIMFANISFDKASPPITCFENTLSELDDLTNVMKDALKRWNKHFSQKRTEFYHLNHYNIQQIKYLCHELAFAAANQEFPDQVYTLLSVIKHDIGLKDVLQCLGEATSGGESASDHEDSDEEESTEEPDAGDMSNAKKKLSVVQQLHEDDIPLKVAMAAVHQAEDLDYDDIYLWCLENENEDDIVNELAKNFEIETGFMESTGPVGVVQSVVQDKTTLTLQGVIKKLLDEESKRHGPSVCVNTIFTRYVEESLQTSLSDCISLDHLGQFLNNVSLLVDSSTIPRRNIPEALHQNVNLIICQEQDTFTTLVSLYMHSPEQPLPTATEVLLCSEKTSQSDVDLLLRRAVISNSKKGKRIYCLAHTEKLDFEVANSVEDTLNELQQNEADSFTLAIICSSNQHFIASLFNEQKIEFSIRHSNTELQQYLKSKLNGENKEIAEGHTALLVTSHKAGLGKSLYVSRNEERLPDNWHRTTVRFLEKRCDQDYVLKNILQSGAHNADPHFIHFDVTPAVQHGINYFLFNLIVLGSFEDSYGLVWKKHYTHTYFIEYTSFAKMAVLDPLLLLLPTVTCLSPNQIIEDDRETGWETVGMDEQEFLSETFQRPYQYLQLRECNLDRFTYREPKGNHRDCLLTLLQNCGLEDPSWSEIRHFASFLNYQLSNCEKSVFCDASLMDHDSGLSGFKNFVVKFMIRMSQDFGTPSLVATRAGSDRNDEVFEAHQLRRSWEQSQHPYLFFNEDGVSMTFLNFQINQNGDLISLATGHIIEKNIMSKSLVQGLMTQKVKLQQNFDELSRSEKLRTLYRVLGIKEAEDPEPKDPDPSYELTTDNVLKMLAIHMRFRCDIPVIIMGETGCGKTRMVEFLSKLKANNFKSGKKETADPVTNMVIVKVHGGVTVENIQEKVIKASELAEENKKKCDTILFLDEANTTEAIYAIKEFVCDGSVCGKPIAKTGLNIVAACNPYRKHSDEAIKKMENAGLGFKVKTDDTTDKLGEIPMRCLVYRVIALPPSMHPLVWDFGQLRRIAERVYIEQMVNHSSVRECVQLQAHRQLMVHILSSSQEFMRQNRQECLFVSLRDVERCVVSFKWFHSNKEWLFSMIRRNVKTKLDLTIQCLIQAVAMCYHATLLKRDDYRIMLSRCFGDCGINISELQILQEIISCQEVFLKSIKLGDDIASNEALRENVFMIVMCSEMRIPLFLIGKPGSSKSLAKTIVTDAMQGSNSCNAVFQRLKQVHVLSFQCSPVTDAVGIENVFKQCESLQNKQDCTKFVAVVVLDEIGLAEDSPKMPLKVLHPLLESGVANSSLTTSTSTEHKEKMVGFVGISNWALDPAKMNRGLFVYRGAPTEEDLKLTAKGIFSSETTKYSEVSEIVDAVTKSYLEVDEKRKSTNEEGCEQTICDREFFGLRDYYGLLKMIYAVFCNQETTPSFYDVAYAVQRNFSGAKTDCKQIFMENLKAIWPSEKLPEITVEAMIAENLRVGENGDSTVIESRYLLLMTNHLAAVNLLDNILEDHGFEVVFGSSFPLDDNYTEKCRNINHIKMCMEAGTTVLLLNLKDLYESLYDALNQHYVTFAGQRYVDLGLGGHRVKCRVHKNFRLVVMEDMEIVYKEFPIPLINRLEKHIFTTKSLLTTGQMFDVQRLEQWVHDFTAISQPRYLNEVRFTKTDAFVGYIDDTVGSAVISVKKGKRCYETAQLLLLNTATCDSIMRLEKSVLKKEAAKWQEKYFEQQHHDNLFDLLQSCTESDARTGIVEMDVVSFSQIISDKDRQILENSLGLGRKAIMLITLQQFKTVAQFAEKLATFADNIKAVKHREHRSYIILIQCPQAHTSQNLIACAKHTVKNVLRNQLGGCNAQLIVTFLFTVERQSELHTQNQIKSFISQETNSVFVDELRVKTVYLGSLSKIIRLEIGELFEMGLRKRHYNSKEEQQTNFADPEFTLDLKYLLVHSLSLALTKLEYSNKSNYDQRIKQLLSAFSSEDNISCAFVQVIAESVADLAHKRDALSASPSLWTKTVALSPMELQEGGSYSKTLWLHLRKLASAILAFVISEIDEDHNLDILWCQSSREVHLHLKNVWFKMYQDKTFSSFTWNNIDKLQRLCVRGSEDFVCQFPFGRKLVDIFQKQWELVHYQQKAEINFHSRIRHMPLNEVLKLALEVNTVATLKCFIHDLVCLHYKCGTGQKLEVNMIQDMFIEVWKHKQEKYDEDVAISSNLAALVFVMSKKFHAELKQVSSILTLQPDILTNENVRLWIEGQAGQDTITIHKDILKSALERIKDESDDLKKIDQYHRWADLIKEIQPTAEAILLHNPGTESQEKLWKALAFGALFLEQLIPPGLDETLHQGYLEVLLPSSKRLWKGALKVGLNTDKYLNVLIKNLNGSVNKIRLMYLLDSQDSICKQCKKMIVDPVLLPCKHFMCLRCTHFIALAPQCPTCRAALPGNFVPTPVSPSPRQASDMEVLSASCTSFFLEYLSTFCFPAPGSNLTHGEVKKNVTTALHGLVIQNRETRDMTPLHSAVFDSTPTARSFILQLLLRHERRDVEEELELHLATVGNVLKDKVELMRIYIQCIEDTLQQTRKVPILQLLQMQIQELEEGALFRQLQHLDVAANLRFIVNALIEKIHRPGQKEDDGFVQDVAENLIQLDSETVQKYFVKVFCRRYGIGLFPSLLENIQVKRLVPNYLHSDEKQQMADFLIMSGKSMEEIRKCLNKCRGDENMQEVFDEIHVMCQEDSPAAVVLGAVSWAVSKNKCSDKMKKHASAVGVLKHMQKHQLISSYTCAVAEKAIQQWGALFHASSFMHQILSDLFLDAIVTVSSSNDSLIAQLHTLVTNHSGIENMFLPTMPQSSYFDVRAIVATWLDPNYKLPPKEYLCPNGHLYFVGDCTNVAQVTAFCPDCGEPIGGVREKVLKPGNKEGKLTESSQAGYKLPFPKHRGAESTPERNCNRLSVSVIRFLLHSSLLMQASQYGVQRLIGVANVDEARQLLVLHLETDLKQFSNSMGKSLEDSALLLHQILKTIRQPNSHGMYLYNYTFSSMEERKLWESEFQRIYLSPAFKHADQMINEARNIVLQAKQKSDLECLVYEIPSGKEESGDDASDVVPWDHPSLWQYHINITVKHLRQKLSGDITCDTDDGAVIQLILESPNLSVLCHLEDILKIQTTLVEKYRQRVDVSDIDNISIQDYLKGITSVISEANFVLYVGLWNKYRKQLKVVAGSQLPSEYFDEELTLESPISTCIPSKVGRGQCALLFTKFVVKQQNDLIGRCREMLNPAPKFEIAKISHLNSNDIISIKSEEVLLPYVLANSQYEATTSASGSKHQIKYRIRSLQKQILQRFILYKKVIDDESLQCIDFLQDIGMVDEFELLEENISQEKLPMKIMQKLEDMKGTTTMPMICEAVRTLTLVVKNLSKMKEDRTTNLVEYIKNGLMLSEDEKQLIPSSSKLYHTRALFEWFSWQRSLKYVIFGQDPFRHVVKEEECENFEDMERMTRFLNKVDKEQLQIEINSFLIMKSDLNINEGLKHYLGPFADEREVEAPWIEIMPEEISVKHAVHLFKTSVQQMYSF